MDVDTNAQQQEAGVTSYYQQKIEHLEITVRDKTQNLRRLQAQRNELNSKGTRVPFKSRLQCGERLARQRSRCGKQMYLRLRLVALL